MPSCTSPYIVAGQQSTSYTKRELLRAFRLFADPTLPPGYITPEAMEKSLMTYCSEKVTAEEAMRLVSQLETNADGNINYFEKVNLFMSG